MPEFVLLPDSSGQPVSRQEEDGVSLRYISQDGTVTWLPEDWSPSPETPAIPPSLVAAETRISPPSAQWYGWGVMVARQMIYLMLGSLAAGLLLAMASVSMAWLTASDSINSGNAFWFAGAGILLGNALWLWRQLRRQVWISRMIDEQEPGYAPPAPDPRELGPMTVPAIWGLGGTVTVIALYAITTGLSEHSLRLGVGVVQLLFVAAGSLYTAHRLKVGQSAVE